MPERVWRYQYLLYVEADDGTFRFLEGRPDDLRKYKAQPGEFFRLVRRWGLFPKEWSLGAA